MWFLIALAGILVLGIAFYSVFRVSSRLANTEALSVYDPKAAADFIMSELPSSIALERHEVEFLMRSHLDYLRASGIANQGLADTMAITMAEKTSEPLADENELVDFTLEQLKEAEFEIDVTSVVVVLDLSVQYLVSVGAVGSSVENDTANNS